MTIVKADLTDARLWVAYIIKAETPPKITKMFTIFWKLKKAKSPSKVTPPNWYYDDYSIAYFPQMSTHLDILIK